MDLACDMRSYDYFHSDDPVEAAKSVVSEAVAALWESVLRHDGFAAHFEAVLLRACAAFRSCHCEPVRASLREGAGHGCCSVGYLQFVVDVF